MLQTLPCFQDRFIEGCQAGKVHFIQPDQEQLSVISQSAYPLQKLLRGLLPLQTTLIQQPVDSLKDIIQILCPPVPVLLPPLADKVLLSSPEEVHNVFLDVVYQAIWW